MVAELVVVPGAVVMEAASTAVEAMAAEVTAAGATEEAVVLCSVYQIVHQSTSSPGADRDSASCWTHSHIWYPRGPCSRKNSSTSCRDRAAIAGSRPRCCK